ncbi:MAG: VOC family protein [Acidobacteriota bacterium]
MSNNFRFDHAVILVADLTTAIAAYSSLGFNVIEGGKHKNSPTQNALIPLSDDSYLELIAANNRFVLPALSLLKRLGLLRRVLASRTGFTKRLLSRAAFGEGLVDFALLSSVIEENIKAMRNRGLFVEGPIQGGRERPDGERVAWQLGLPGTQDLPFLCADVTARELRVPKGDICQHPNGILAVGGIVVAVLDLDASVRRYCALLDTQPLSGSTSPLRAARTVDFLLHDITITLAMPTEENGPIYQYIKKRGEGPYRLKLLASNGKTGLLDTTLTKDVHIELLTRLP